MKRFLIGLVVLAVASVSVGIAAADGPGGGPFGRGKSSAPVAGIQVIAQVVTEETGLTEEELFDALHEEGATLTSVIEANGGDVSVVRTNLIEAMTERLEENAANNPDRVGPVVENIEAHVDLLLTRTWNYGEGFGPGSGEGFGPGRMGRGHRIFGEGFGWGTSDE